MGRPILIPTTRLRAAFSCAALAGYHGGMWNAAFGAIIGAAIGDGVYVLFPGAPPFVTNVAAIACIVTGAWLGWNRRAKPPQISSD
jgi:uncharacterized membrane protein YjjP (DUF1212 family)